MCEGDGNKRFFEKEDDWGRGEGRLRFRMGYEGFRVSMVELEEFVDKKL